MAPLRDNEEGLRQGAGCLRSEQPLLRWCFFFPRDQSRGNHSVHLLLLEYAVLIYIAYYTGGVCSIIMYQAEGSTISLQSMCHYSHFTNEKALNDVDLSHPAQRSKI